MDCGKRGVGFRPGPDHEAGADKRMGDDDVLDAHLKVEITGAGSLDEGELVGGDGEAAALGGDVVAIGADQGQGS